MASKKVIGMTEGGINKHHRKRQQRQQHGNSGGVSTSAENSMAQRQ